MSEKETHWATFLVLNRHELAEDLELLGHWYFSRLRWVMPTAKQIYAKDLTYVIKQYLVTNFPITIDELDFITPAFIMKTTGNFFFKKENLK